MNNQNKPNNRNKAINKLTKESCLTDLFLYFLFDITLLFNLNYTIS